MQRRGGPRLLVTDREGALYLERAHVHVEGGRVVYRIADDENAREFNIPHVNLAVLFLGQGTSITQDAVRLLGEEHVHLAITGTGGAPLHMGALTTYTSTEHFRRLLPIYLDPALSLRAAVSVMHGRVERMRRIGGKLARGLPKGRNLDVLTEACKRFERTLPSCENTAQLLGHEGTFSKACYRIFGDMVGVPEFRRIAHGEVESTSRAGAEPARIALINRLIDHGNYLCYGMAGAALWALGVPPHLSVFHGKTRPGGLVFDVADGFKDALVLPIAFRTAMRRSAEPEKEFRAELIAAFDDNKILAETIDIVETLLAAAEEPAAA